MGYHQRTEYNKRVLKIGTDGNTPKQALTAQTTQVRQEALLPRAQARL
jgi:ribosomal protein L3